MKDYIESGRFERHCESLFDRCEAVIPWVAVFCSGVLLGIAWMIAQQG